MQSAVYVAIIALILSFISLITTIIIAAKNYKKSKRLEFFQRRDQLFMKIADLNAKNSDAHLISARYEIVSVNKLSLRLEGKQAEENKTQIASIKKIREDIELGAKHWDARINELHSICSSLTSKTDATRVERLIAMVQEASDDVKKYNEVSLSSLHILESTNSIIKTILSEIDEKERRIDLDLERAIREFKRNEESPN